MEFDKKMCPVLDVEGFIASGRQFDIDITLPRDSRDVVYGIVKDEYGDPIADAVVKLIEVSREHCEEVRKPISHTFTDREGEFVFGPLCSDRSYEVQIWANRVKHCKICKTCNRKGKCLKGVELDCPNKHYDKYCDYKEKDEYDKYYDHKEKDECKKYCDYKEKDECKKCCDHKEKDECKKCCDHKEKDECKKCCDHKEKDECKKCCKRDLEEACESDVYEF